MSPRQQLGDGCRGDFVTWANRVKISPEKPMRVAVLHGNALAEAQALADRIKIQYNPLELLVNITGPVLGIHTGPRALALCGYNED